MDSTLLGAYIGIGGTIIGTLIGFFFQSRIDKRNYKRVILSKLIELNAKYESTSYRYIQSAQRAMVDDYYLNLYIAENNIQLHESGIIDINDTIGDKIKGQAKSLNESKKSFDETSIQLIEILSEFENYMDKGISFNELRQFIRGYNLDKYLEISYCRKSEELNKLANNETFQLIYSKYSDEINQQLIKVGQVFLNNIETFKRKVLSR